MADDNRGGGSTAIIVALIGTAGVVAAALIGTFGRGSPPANPTSTQTVGGGASPLGAATPTGNPGASAAGAQIPAPTVSPPTSLPNFAGAWQLENNPSAPMLRITQMGDSVQMGDHTMTIRPDGSIGYQSFSASDQNSGHAVASAEQADLVDTFTWMIAGDELVFRTLFDTRHPYFNQPVGKVTRIMRYRRAG